MIGRWVEVTLYHTYASTIYRVVVTNVTKMGVFGPYLSIRDNKIGYKGRNEGLFPWREIENLRFL